METKVLVNCAYDEMVPLHKLVPNPRNPNTHPEEQLRLLAKIIDYQGWRNPIVVSTRSGFIVKGHARLTAAERLGLTEVPVDYQDYESEAQEWADLLADNRIAELAEMDRPMLKDLLQEIDTGDFDLELTGFTETVLEDMMTEFHVPSEGLTDDDAVPEDVEPLCKTGDLWQLGNHRLLCGDATKREDVERLMGGEKADMVFTDPPYGINVVGSDGKIGGGSKGVPSRTVRQIKGDDRQFDLLPLLKLAPISVIWGGNYYAHLLPFGGVWFVWDKMRRMEDHSFSDCELAWTNIKGVVVKQYELLWDGYARSGSRKDEGLHRYHPAQKPVGLITNILSDYGKAAISILDLFGGSGSTLIACEKLGRRCFMMEIDEHYCDVIIKRWEDFTGKQAVKVGND